MLLCALSVAGANAPEASGQVGITARVGTLGVGAEAAVDVAGRIAVRGGAGLAMGLATFRPTTTFDDISVQLDLPSTWYNLGLDYYLNEVFRVGGGLVFVTEEPTLRGLIDDPVDIGGTTLTATEIGLLTGEVSTNKQAAYALVGFGRHSSTGIGLSVDVGAAFLGSDPSISLAAVGGSYPQDDMIDLLNVEEREFESDMKTYLKIWPIMSVGLRYGIG